MLVHYGISILYILLIRNYLKAESIRYEVVSFPKCK